MNFETSRPASTELLDYTSASEGEVEGVESVKASQYACHHCYSSKSRDWYHARRDGLLLCTDCRLFYKKYDQLRSVDRPSTVPPCLFKRSPSSGDIDEDSGVRTRAGKKERRRKRQKKYQVLFFSETRKKRITYLNLQEKGEGYHLDLFVIAILVLICSFLGLPFYVAATVLSVMHVNSLRLQSETSAPGEIPRFLGVNEQRMSAFLAHFLIGLSVLLTGIIKLVPLPVLIGIFLYMGVVSLLGQQFVQRIGLLFMSVKNQPDYVWLRTVRMRRVHLFTLIQLLSIGALFAIKYTKYISMMFPLMLVVMVLLRMFVLARIFTQVELSALDDMIPSFKQVVNPRRNRRKNKEMVDLLEKK